MRFTGAAACEPLPEHPLVRLGAAKPLFGLLTLVVSAVGADPGRHAGRIQSGRLIQPAAETSSVGSARPISHGLSSGACLIMHSSAAACARQFPLLAAAGPATGVLRMGVQRVMHGGNRRLSIPVRQDVVPAMHTVTSDGIRKVSAMNAITSEPGVVELTREEGRKMLDER